jgi:hypothetical protein
MRDYDEKFECFDDSICEQCGHKFPADIEIVEGTPQFVGFCSNLCMTNNKLGINSPFNGEMAELLTAELGRDTPEGWSKSIYKGTPCGAWLSPLPQSIQLGSIVEGSDEEIGPIELNWPFSADQLWGALDEINNAAEYYWQRDNYIWFYIDYTPADKPAERFYGVFTWDDTEWGAEKIPSYVKNKVNDWYGKNPDIPDFDRGLGLCLGVSITIYNNDLPY